MKKKNEEKEIEERVRVWKIRGEATREVSTPQALKLLDPLLLSRLLSYPLSSQLLTNKMDPNSNILPKDLLLLNHMLHSPNQSTSLMPLNF